MMKRFVSSILTLTFLWASQLPTLASELVWKSELHRDHPLVGKIYDTATQSFISEPQLLARLTSGRYVLLGETHDNADHHVLQARIINRLVASGQRPAVVMEMISSKQWKALLEVVASDHKTADDIRDATEWNKSGWPSFDLYRPIFEAAITHRLIIGPTDYGDDQASTIEKTIENVPLSDKHYTALGEELKISHCGVLPDSVIPKIATAQMKRDVQLAFALPTGRATNEGKAVEAVLIAGSGHTRKDRGVPHYLRNLYGQTSVTVNFREVAEGKTNPLDLFEPGEADYIWFTPRHSREDPCVALRKRFGKTQE